MSESTKGGRGRGGRRRGGAQQQPITPGGASAAASTPATTTPGKGRGRGRVSGDDQPVSPPAAAAAAIPIESKMSTLTMMDPADIGKKDASTKAKEQAAEQQLIVEQGQVKEAMKRPGVGTKGRAIQLYANHFPVKIPDGLIVYHYDFAIARKFKRKKGSVKPKPKLVTRRRDEEDDDDSGSIEEVIGDDGNFEIVVKKRNKWPKWLSLAVYKRLVTDPAFGLVNFRNRMAYDGAKNVFAQCHLPVPRGDSYEMELQIPDEDRVDSFVVTLNFITEVAVDLREVFRRSLADRRSTSTLVLDIILRQSKIFNNVIITHGSRSFYHPQNPASLGGGLWHYPGIWESVRPVSGWKSTINLDLANTAFVKYGPLIDILGEIARDWQRNRGLSDRDIKALDKLVKGIKVDMNHRPGKRSARCVAVTRQSAQDLTFMCDTQGGAQAPLSVAKYFDMMHRKGEFRSPVRYPFLPCLHVGNKEKKNYVPLEFCEIKPGQRYNQKLNDYQTSAMLKAASQSAPDRKRYIEEEARRFELGQDPFLKGFGLTVEMKMVNLGGRVLDAPAIEYDQNAKINPKQGEWNLRDVRVIRGATIRSWGVINTDRNIGPQDIERFCNGLMAEAKKLGITFTSKMPVCCDNEDNADNIERDIKFIKEKATNPETKASTLDLVLVILAVKNSIFYSSTKSAGDVAVGVNTQCILGKNLTKGGTPLFVNFLLKINAKLGGVNSKLVDGSRNQIRQLREPILIIGADVNHPAPTDGESSPSVAAVVANMDGYLAQYLAKIMVQKRRQEPIADLEVAVCEMIFQFRKRTGQLPKRIVMYRDGVGESMFLKVLNDELHAMRRACTKMGENFKLDKPYEPPITFIVVQKRHHTRFFCANQQDETGRGKNIPPGTTVDTAVVHPEEFDFYLCSHLGLQGTSRPTHYHVLWDDSDFTADELQMLTYYLCYTYARAMKSVSIPPPCYYADLCAYRARQYLSWSWQSASESGSTMSGSSHIDLSQLKQFVEVKANVAEKGMFFV